MAKPKKNEGELRVTRADGVSQERALADVALDPIAGAAATANSFSKPLFGSTELSETYVALAERARDIRQNKLGSIENMLTAQAAALNAIFLELARRSGANMGEYLNAAERYMRLALKAQGQCRATLETLAAVKNPPVVYARQANIAAGHQQVNNGNSAPARGENSKDLPSELLEAPNETIERLDPGTTGSPIRSNPELETVDTINRSSNTDRQESLKP